MPVAGIGRTSHRRSEFRDTRSGSAASVRTTVCAAAHRALSCLCALALCRRRAPARLRAVTASCQADTVICATPVRFGIKWFGRRSFFVVAVQVWLVSNAQCDAFLSLSHPAGGQWQSSKPCSQQQPQWLSNRSRNVARARCRRTPKAPTVIPRSAATPRAGTSRAATARR